MQEQIKGIAVKYINRRKKNITQISMINLIDIIFMLLIFFMLTTTFKTFSEFNIKLPESKADFKPSKDEIVEILLDKNKEIILNHNNIKIKLSEDELVEKLSTLNENLKKHIKLSADKSLKYGQIIGLISLLKDANIENVELNIERK